MTTFLFNLLQENCVLLAIPLSAAIVGYAAGRHLRGRDGERLHQSKALKERHAMKVRELMAHLLNQDPDATVMLLPDDVLEEDAQAVRSVRSVRSGETAWTHEQGSSKGRPYEALFPGEPHGALRYDCENVTYESDPVILLII